MNWKREVSSLERPSMEVKNAMEKLSLLFLS